MLYSRLHVFPKDNKKMWEKFTYFGEEIGTLTNIFKNFAVNITYNTNNTIKKHCNIHTYNDKYSACGVYELKYLTCDQVYVGQTGRNFRIK
jgi:hypothetical protein